MLFWMAIDAKEKGVSGMELDRWNQRKILLFLTDRPGSSLARLGHDVVDMFVPQVERSN